MDLYQPFTRSQAISSFGTETGAQSYCDGQWLFLTNEKVICLAPLGKAPADSHFGGRMTFVWVADKPYNVSPLPSYPFIPPQVMKSTGIGRLMFLFVRPKDYEHYLYIGVMNPTFEMTSPRGNSYGTASFYFSPALPSPVWARLGGPPSPAEDPALVEEIAGLVIRWKMETSAAKLSQDDKASAEMIAGTLEQFLAAARVKDAASMPRLTRSD